MALGLRQKKRLKMVFKRKTTKSPSRRRRVPVKGRAKRGNRLA